MQPATPATPAFPPPPPLPELPAPPGPPRRRRARRVVAAVLAVFLVLAAADVVALVAVTHPSDRGDPASYAFLQRHDGAPVRWDPCTPIHYALDPRYAPPDAPEILRQVTQHVTDATGIRFVYDGTTPWSPEAAEMARYAATAPTFHYLPVLIAWLPASRFRNFAPPHKILAVGIPYSPPGAYRYVSGMIVVNAAQDMPDGWAMRYSLGPVLLHEFGHLMGLAHVDDPEQLMWSDRAPGAQEGDVPDLSTNDWGAGDRAGLEQLGIEQGCLTPTATPTP
ncbi:MAG: matrixin family metalloprotease [Planctomycetaceae bacterium]